MRGGFPCHDARLTFILEGAAVGELPKDLKDWTDKDVIEWATVHYPDLLKELKEKVPSGSTLAELGEEKFEKYCGGDIGAAFYNKLKRQGTLHSLRILAVC